MPPPFPQGQPGPAGGEDPPPQELPHRPAGGPNHMQGPPPPQAAPQLPPQMFTTAAQLLDLTDKKLMLVLRDGRKLIGVLRSWDQFANLVLQDTIERTFANDLYADIPRGIFLVRGENVLLLGEIDLDKDDVVPAPFRAAPAAEVHGLAKQAAAERRRKTKIKGRTLGAEGFEAEGAGEVLF